jgi:hypothetical protein
MRTDLGLALLFLLALVTVVPIIVAAFRGRR